MVYKILNEHLKNLNENELKLYKKNSDIRDLCYILVNNLYGKNMNTLACQSYYSYLLSCLKCKNLEKKMNALNDISEIINDFPQSNNKIDITFNNFIENNKILEMFLFMMK